MKQNLGGFDRGIRILGGLTLIALTTSGMAANWGLLGLLPVASGVLGWSPPFALLGINTSRLSKQH